MNLNFLLELIAGTLEEAGESKLVEVLVQLKKDQPADYEAASAGAKALVIHVLPLVQKTKTKIDDIFISGLGEAFDTVDAV
jgi:hypothetical protein